MTSWPGAMREGILPNSRFILATHGGIMFAEPLRG